MTKEQQNVKEFMRMFGQETPEAPTQIDENTAKLRASLMLEECLETIMQGLGLSIMVDFNDGRGFLSGNPKDQTERYGVYFFSFVKEKEVDLVELADGLADLAYVGPHGTACAAGIDLEPIEKAVDESNKSKLWSADDLVKHWGDEEEKNYFYCQCEDPDWFIVKRKSDRKVVKSPSYHEVTPEIVRIIEEQKNKEEISVNTLKMLERSIAEFKKGEASSPKG